MDTRYRGRKSTTDKAANFVALFAVIPLITVMIILAKIYGA